MPKNAQNCAKKRAALHMSKNILLCMLLASSWPARSEEITMLDKVVDVGFYRPAGFLATALGVGAFAAMLPMAAVATLFPPHDSFLAFADALVLEPAEFTFNRPLGAPMAGWLAAAHPK